MHDVFLWCSRPQDGRVVILRTQIEPPPPRPHHGQLCPWTRAKGSVLPVQAHTAQTAEETCSCQVGQTTVLWCFIVFLFFHVLFIPLN